MKVAEWIRRCPGQVATVPPHWLLDEVADRLLQQSGLRDLYVVDENGRVLGHLSHRRLARLLLAEHRPVHSRRQIMERVAGGTADELMEPHFMHALPEEELEDVLQRLLEHEIEDMVVIDDLGTLVGAINLTQVLRGMREQTI